MIAKKVFNSACPAIASIALILYITEYTFLNVNVFIDFFQNIEPKIYKATDLQNIEIYDNYSLLHRTMNYRRIRVCLDTDYDGNWMDRDSLGYQHIVYSHYQKASVCKIGLVSYDKFIEPGRQYFGPLNFTGVNNSLISHRKMVVGWSRHFQFGHFLQDMVCGVISIPSEIVKDAEIFVAFPEPNAKAFFKLLGYDEDHVHGLTDELIFGHDVYIAVSDFGMNGLFKSWVQLREIVYSVNHLYDIKPVNHFFMNKNVGNWGYVKNMIELYNITKKLYPQYNWIYHDDSIINKNLTEFARFMASVKLFVSGAGSIVFNNYLMHNETGILVVSRSLCDNPAFQTALHYHMWLLALAGEVVTPNGINITEKKFLAGVHDIIHATYKSRWPVDIDNRTRIHFVFNVTDYFKKGEEIFSNKTTETFIKLRYKNKSDRYRKLLTKKWLFSLL
ncbi:hypothetical protein TVAG_061210 [Trichomonas vaginalis G3]|uniref:Glycosyltransferase 61 catalytic domain-containing protein n=1 Tax=Trichomonas vaginalis (strain ATCC PRA-98 / G3) TaxID=412133 RepID=A2G9M5_TRIV3|nr:glycosyltransferase family [Trichomonas vaginalis G3]EAX86143.1 hypothetical protein TVAG_061210 [Trichomonas vaginalis G3]KAI5539865.1 glycosyltransferase family [Trichomonas vaginalis G3]|eukprot:XP_001299073.1 hypothetical protein [Trichomonas vaginalis G3]